VTDLMRVIFRQKEYVAKRLSSVHKGGRLRDQALFSVHTDGRMASESALFHPYG